MEKIVAGVDGSDASERALGLALHEAELRGAEVVAVHAWELPIASRKSLSFTASVLYKQQERP